MTSSPNDNDNPWGSPSGKRPSGQNGGGQNPWNHTPGGGPQKPVPDFDSLKKAGQSVLNDFMGGNASGGKTFLIFALLLLVFWGISGFFQVNATQLGIVMRLGVVQRIENPGLHYRLPYPFEDAIMVDVTLAQRIAVGYQNADDYSMRGDEIRKAGESMMLTGDENIIDISFDVTWQVDPVRVKDYVFRVKEPRTTVKAVAESAMREIIGQTSIQTAITTGRAEIEMKTLELMQKILDQYQTGVQVTQVNLRASMPPAEVADAFQDVTRARSDKETKINQADTYRNNIVPEAEGQAAKMLQEAGAYKEQIVNQAQGNAQRFISVYQSYQGAREVTAKQMYLETMETVLQGANKLVVDPSLKGVSTYLPLQNILSAAQTKNEER